jgi:SEFIR domain
MAEQDKSSNSLAGCGVFISYSHDSPEHEERVLALANQLRNDGIEAWIDRYVQDPDEGWIRWMRSQVKQASRVLLVFTENYQRRFEGDEEEGKGRGATFEGVIVTQELYESGGRNEKFRAVVFRQEDERFIPLELRQFSHYRVNTQENYEALLRWLHGTPRIKVPIVRQKPDLPAEPAPELFSRNPVIGIDRQTTPTQTETFANEQELILNVRIKVSPISRPWKYESRRRIVRMPRQFVESEGFGWNFQALLLDVGFRQLLLLKARLAEDSDYNFYLEDLRYFDGDVNELKEEPHQVGDNCEVWDIS